jgi:hypothetical protein
MVNQGRTRRAVVAATAALLLAAVAGCDAADIRETSARACANGLDDDGNGQVDCADPACAGSGACEATEESCHDGVDNDGNQAADCQEAGCRAAGFCNTFAADCQVAPQQGCPVGMACYRASVGTSTAVETRCRIAGVGQAGTACNGDAIGALGAGDAHPCATGYACSFFGSSDGICGAYCNSDGECPAGAICAPSPTVTGHAGICTTPCNPVSGNGCPSAQYSCFSFHETGTAFESGGARFACYSASRRHGRAVEAQACADPPTAATPDGMVCGPGTVCVGTTPGAGVCRAVCEVNGAPCRSGSCATLYPAGRPAALGPHVYGVCM